MLLGYYKIKSFSGINFLWKYESGQRELITTTANGVAEFSSLVLGHFSTCADIWSLWWCRIIVCLCWESLTRINSFRRRKQIFLTGFSNTPLDATNPVQTNKPVSTAGQVTSFVPRCKPSRTRLPNSFLLRDHNTVSLERPVVTVGLYKCN